MRSQITFYLNVYFFHFPFEIFASKLILNDKSMKSSFFPSWILTSCAYFEFFGIGNLKGPVGTLTLLTVDNKLPPDIIFTTAAFFQLPQMHLLVIFILVVFADQIPDEVMSFFLDFFNQHGKVFVELDNFLVCCNNALKLTVVELFMVTVADYQNW